MDMFKDEIWRLARTKFGVISEKIEQRLIAETDCIEEYGRGEMLQTMWRLVDGLKKHDINISLTLGQGYNVSLVCYLLGISTFNPMDHPELITEAYVKSTFKSSSEITFRIDKDETEVIDNFLGTLKCEIERKDMLGNHSRRVKASRDSDFTFEFKHVCNSGRIRIIGDLIGWDQFERFPTDDRETMKLIQEIDIFGTTTYSFAPITIEAIRHIRPSNVNELTDAMSFTFEKQYGHLLIYLENRESGNKVFTGHTEIDEILSDTYGIILYTRQMGEILKLPIRHATNDADGKETIRERYRSLAAFPIVNKCDTYVKGYNLYRLAYAKVHFPNEFKEALH